MKSDKSNSYTALAHVYNVLNQDVDYAEYAKYIDRCFGKYLPQKPMLVLDLACGTGRITTELARLGYDMIGLDISADMLSEAMACSAPEYNILYLMQDMRSFELYGTVGAVVCCLDGLNYLTGDDDLDLCFAAVHNYLDPDGLFVFDMNTPFKFERVYGNNAYILESELSLDSNIEIGSDADTKTAAVYCGWQNDFNNKTKLCDFWLTVFTETPEGYRRSDEHQVERCYDKEEIKNALQKNGFQIYGVFGDIDELDKAESSADCFDCERWYWVARCIKI